MTFFHWYLEEPAYSNGSATTENLYHWKNQILSNTTKYYYVL